ncbi:DUF5317 family protein [Clostridium sediminicola]|uniref:DUF5317 family protein n=1 Tax=Clostridium sediminicola TaxID=3114879 RepID=UPI0031F24CDC
MIESLLLALLVAKLKGYKLKPLFKSWAFYPVLVYEVFYIFLAITIFMEDYRFVKYAKIFTTLHLLCFLILIVKYQLYKSSVIGSISIFIGSVLNKIAIAANGGKMPVFPTLSYYTGYSEKGAFPNVDNIHILGSSSTQVKFLTDYIDLGYTILSIGDIFIHFFSFVIIFSAIRQLNMK